MYIGNEYLGYCNGLVFLGQNPDQQSVWCDTADNDLEDNVVIPNEYHQQSAAPLVTSFRCKIPKYLYLTGDERYIAISKYWAAKKA
jgi:hypothetical protein